MTGLLLTKVAENSNELIRYKRLSASQLVGATLGVALEVYDFAIYSYFAIAIGKSFFPSKSPFIGLILSLATFGVGFLSRPIGAVVLGSYADRCGRNSAMLLSFGLMGLGLLVIAITPPYSQIGVAAPLTILCARIIQGFAFGGEVGAATALLLEASSRKDRGFHCSLQYAGQGFAAFLAGTVGVILSSFLAPPALDTYGWRIAFLLGVAILPLGLLVRRILPETLNTPDRYPAEPHPGRMPIWFLGLLIISSGTISNYLFHYMTTYALTDLHIGSKVAYAVPMVTGLSIGVFSVIGGTVSDRLGRRSVMIYPSALSLITTYLVFHLIVSSPSALTLWGGMAFLSALYGLSSGASITAIAESLTKSTRSTRLSLIYAAAVSIFGGSAQSLVVWITYVTENPMAIAWYATTASAIGFVAQYLMAETMPCKTDDWS